MRWLSKGIAFPFKEKDTDEDKFGADIQFKWYHSEFPCFPPVRFKTKAAFRVAGGAKSESGYKVTLRTSWSFFSPDITSFEQKDWVPKKPDWPSGVGITAAMKVSVGELLQANVSINQSLEEAGLNGRQLFQRVLDTKAQAKEMADIVPAGSFDARVKHVFCLANCHCQDE